MTDSKLSQISDHQQSKAPAPSRGLPHTPSWWSLIAHGRLDPPASSTLGHDRRQHRSLVLLNEFLSGKKGLEGGVNM